ncbi:MAG: conserved membrane protein of unknown function [Promethearchaeota archaeon]|nr:MAG: conserved membrane protein of unknown function [Candidatus Lokiarchaeota archaeon]
MANLNLFDYIHGITTLTFVLLSIIIGIRLLTKYKTLKRKEIITVGLAWIFLSSAWWGSSFSFLSILIANYEFEELLFFSLANLFIPVALVCWIYSFSHIIYPNSEKKITIPFLVISAIYEVILIILLLNPSSYPEYIGEIRDEFYYSPGILTLVFQLLSVLITIITGYMFSYKSLKATDKKVKWKGRFLVIAFTLFIVGALFDALIPMDEITVVIVRSILILSAIFYYLGFLLPDRLAELLGAIEK